MKKVETISPWKTLKWVLIFMVIMIGMVYGNVKFNELVEESEDMQGRCDGYGYLDTEYDCCNDCHDLNMTYVKGKYVDTGFLSESDYQCTCKNNKEEIVKIY